MWCANNRIKHHGNSINSKVYGERKWRYINHLCLLKFPRFVYIHYLFAYAISMTNDETVESPYICIVSGYSKVHFVYALSQWETTLRCNVVSHWLGAYTDWTLLLLRHQRSRVFLFPCHRFTQKYRTVVDWHIHGMWNITLNSFIPAIWHIIERDNTKSHPEYYQSRLSCYSV